MEVQEVTPCSTTPHLHGDEHVGPYDGVEDAQQYDADLGEGKGQQGLHKVEGLPLVPGQVAGG